MNTYICGQEFVIYLACDSHIHTEILTVVSPLPNAADSMEAEAIGAAGVFNEIINLLRQPESKGFKP